MDILNKELNEIYVAQQLHPNQSDKIALQRLYGRLESATAYWDGCMVVCDVAAMKSRLIGRSFARTIGVDASVDIDSLDEDEIYARIHPEDLVEKRMLELEYLTRANIMDADTRLGFRAECVLRMRDAQGRYITVHNTTRIVANTPEGKIAVIMCTYEYLPSETNATNICPVIVYSGQGMTERLSFDRKRQALLTSREKQIIRLIKSGKLSKEIAADLGISIHTVSRHRQNILVKLSCDNSHEAVLAAEMMRLL